MSKGMRGTEALPPPRRGPRRLAAPAAIGQRARRARVRPPRDRAAACDAIVARLLASMAAAQRHEEPYRHWRLQRCIPEDVLERLLALPFPAPDLGGISGKRDLHNAARRYFSPETRVRHAVCDAFCRAFQDRRVASQIEDRFGAMLTGTALRVEYAQDTDGFWLEPHTDLGVKALTLLLYLSRDPAHAGLGTDLYDCHKRHVGRVPFAPNTATVFVPSGISYHGFEPRRIEGVRKSVIVNYVGAEWCAREQLAFPGRPIRRR